MGHMMRGDHGMQMAVPMVPMPMAFFAMVMAFMLGMMLGTKKAGGMRGHWTGHGYGAKMGMHHHHHHGFGAPECECGGHGPRESERPAEEPV